MILVCPRCDILCFAVDPGFFRGLAISGSCDAFITSDRLKNVQFVD